MKTKEQIEKMKYDFKDRREACIEQYRGPSQEVELQELTAAYNILKWVLEDDLNSLALAEQLELNERMRKRLDRLETDVQCLIIYLGAPKKVFR